MFTKPPPRPPRLEGQSGIVTVELALFVSLLIFLTFGLISFGSIMFVQNNMFYAARETTRALAVGDITLTEAHDTAADYLVNWGGVNFTVTPTEPNVSDVSVTITALQSEAALLDVLGIFGSDLLQAQVTMRKEIG